jgi:hypothetical protein
MPNWLFVEIEGMKEFVSYRFSPINESWKVFVAAVYKDSYVLDTHSPEITISTPVSEFWNSIFSFTKSVPHIRPVEIVAAAFTPPVPKYNG